MPKITLGRAPTHFSHTVKVKLLDETEGEVPFRFIYRTRKQFGQMIDKMLEDAKVEVANTKPEDIRHDDVAFGVAMLMSKGSEANAKHLMKIAAGWGLDSEFTEENLIAFCDEFPGAALAAMETYRNAITEGRLGN